MTLSPEVLKISPRGLLRSSIKMASTKVMRIKGGKLSLELAADPGNAEPIPTILKLRKK